ncbi:hypothetical protein [Campylobacter sp. RM16187]|uniref:hypothetical protein n=1 Tax=Campylobacter sp. RM16187 TaxID=1660063 RepID=UPI0021B55D88|nr:hypothetical protein [Campylobacter sp. RM16187]
MFFLMLLNLKEFSEQNPIRWAILMGFLSCWAIVIVAFMDAKIDFNSSGQNKETQSLQTVFYLLASYIFIKFFTFFKKFSFFSLALFSLFLIGICLVTNIYLLKLVPAPNEFYQNISYAFSAGLSFIYIFILNLIPSKFFQG